MRKADDHYQRWLAKIKKRAQPSGAISQWAHALAQKHDGDSAIWREHLREILEEEEKASLDLILDLDLITAPMKGQQDTDQQLPLW